MTRRFALAALVLVVALGAWWLSRRAPAPSAPSSASSVTSAPAGPSWSPPTRSRARVPAPPEPPRLSTTELRGGALEGRVVARGTSDGVPGAELGFRRGDVTVTVRADREGGFVLEAPEPGRYELASAVAEGFLPFAPRFGQSPVVFEARPAERVSGVVLQLERVVRLRVVVVSPEGRPVAGAEIMGVGEAGDAAAAAPGPRVTTNAAGEALVPVAAFVLLEARHPDFAPGRGLVTERELATGHLRLVLGPSSAVEAATATISGRVVDAAGRPVAGARVRAARMGPEGRGTVAESRSDAAGAFELVALADGGYLVTAVAGARRARSPAVAGTAGLVLQLGDASATLVLEVTDALTAGPLVAFTVALEQVEPDRGAPLSRVVFDTRGRLEWPELPAGPWQLYVSASGYAPAQLKLELREGSPTRVSVALGPGGRIAGFVTDGKTKQPVSGARVSVLAGIFNESAMAVVSEVTTGADGRFDLGGVEPGLRSIEVAATGYHIRDVSGLRVEAGLVTDAGPVDLTALAPGEEAKLELAGIGLGLSLEGDRLMVGSVVPGGGADAAGVAVGDAILSIEGAPVSAMRFDEAIAAIRGPAGTRVRLVVIRGEARRVVDVERRKIRI